MTLAVFFPSLMGFGILVSGALLISDVVHRMLPNQGRRRRHRLAVGTHGVVARAAHVAGTRLEPPSFLTRTLRSRWAYATALLIAAAGAGVVLVSGLAAHGDPKGLFYDSPWIFGLSIGFGAAFALTALLALTMAVVYRHVPRPLRWLVRTTVVGRLRVPEATDVVVLAEEEGGRT